MVKVFISQPMKGKTDKEILAIRKEIETELSNRFNEPFEIIDSFFMGAPVAANRLWFLGKAIQLLSGADFLYLAKGWSSARGCQIEKACAEAYDIPILGALDE